MGGTRRGTRLTQREAAERLGISVEAIRKRIKRGTLRSDKGEDGKRYVYLDTDPDAGGSQPDSPALTSELRDRLRYVEEQLDAERQAHAEARRIIAGLVERIPQLEPPADSATGARGSPEPGGEQQGSADAPQQPQAAPSRPWWRRVLGS
jgi:hypothetical protein